MLVAFLICVAEVIWLNGKLARSRDLILGYPIFYHSAGYGILELVISSIFMILDMWNISWRIGFVIQLLLLAVHLIFAVSCFFTKDIIDNKEHKIQKKVFLCEESSRMLKCCL